MSHSYRTNVTQVGADMSASLASFDFAVSLESKSLGLMIAEEIAAGIALRFARDHSAPSTGPWPENSDTDREINSGSSFRCGYKSRNRAKYGWDDTNYRTGQMLSFDSLLGQVIVTPTLVTIRYGTGLLLKESKSPTGYIEPADEKITDDEKSFYAHTQGRGFCELDDEICTETFQIISTALGNHIRTQPR